MKIRHGLAVVLCLLANIPPARGDLVTLATFDGANGRAPYCDLTMDSQGNLYGTTSTGGLYSQGTVFEVAAGSNTITTLASFNNTDGSFPVGSLTMDSQGNLYGTTGNGGTFFEIKAGSTAITTLTTFNSLANISIYGGLVVDSQGNLFGTAQTPAGGDLCRVVESWLAKTRSLRWPPSMVSPPPGLLAH